MTRKDLTFILLLPLDPSYLTPIPTTGTACLDITIQAFTSLDPFNTYCYNLFTLWATILQKVLLLTPSELEVWAKTCEQSVKLGPQFFAEVSEKGGDMS